MLYIYMYTVNGVDNDYDDDNNNVSLFCQYN